MGHQFSYNFFSNIRELIHMLCIYLYLVHRYIEMFIVYVYTSEEIFIEFVNTCIYNVCVELCYFIQEMTL